METKLKIDRRSKPESAGVMAKDIPEMRPFLAKAVYSDREIGLYVKACIFRSCEPVIIVLKDKDNNSPGDTYTGLSTEFFNIEYVNIDEIAVTVL